MSLHFHARHIILAATFLLASPVLFAGSALPGPSSLVLTLAEAERIALLEDPLAIRHQRLATAFNEQAVADAQLPDPKLKFGIQALPTDTFNRDQEAMTQLQLGIVQSFPRGNSLALSSQQDRSLAAAEEALATDQIRRVLQSVRNSYLETYYQVHAGEIIDKSRELFKQLINITQSHYASGHSAQQDVLRAELELSLLDDQRTRILAAEEGARADLAKWIGTTSAGQPLQDGLPVLSIGQNRSEMIERLFQHPLVAMEDAKLAASNAAVGLARQQYKPAWSLDITYGKRDSDMPDGSGRPDLLSAMVMVELPLFTEKRQDKRLAASQQRAQAAHYARVDRLRELRRTLENQYVNWLRLGERLSRFQDEVVPQAEQHSRAALNAYQSRVSEFTALMRAYLTELESRLKTLRVEVDRAKAQVNLIYLTGETA